MRNDNVVAAGKLILDNLRKMFIVVGPRYRFFNVDVGCFFVRLYECADIVDEPFGRTESANDCGGKWFAGSIICYGFDGKTDVGCLGMRMETTEMDDFAFVVVLF